jgi:hypothetical protein
MIAFVGKTVTPQATAGINRRLNPVNYPHQLFPHDWGVIQKELLVNEGEKPEWRTLKRVVQATDLDRIYASENTLIGVRFDKTTKYSLIDIDIRSLCHPQVNKNEWDRLMKALEDAGLTDRIIIQSSDSGGLQSGATAMVGVSLRRLCPARRQRRNLPERQEIHAISIDVQRP